jgi:hypothetical protein
MVARLRMTGGTAVHLLCAILLWTGTTLHLPLVNSSRLCMAWMYLFHVLHIISQVIEESVVRRLCPNLRGHVIKSDGKMVINVSR